MKALRYLLMSLAIVSVLSASAQVLAQQPETQMQSISVMQGSGSKLPSAAVSGTVVTGEQPGTYSPANSANTGKKPRKGGWGPGGSDREEPYKDPLGDGWPLAGMLGVYCAYVMVRARAHARVRARRRRETV